MVTSDKELLRDSVGRTGERQSASELVRQVGREKTRTKGLGLRRGMHRGSDAARAMARQAAWEERVSVREMPVQENEYGIGR